MPADEPVREDELQRVRLALDAATERVTGAYQETTRLIRLFRVLGRKADPDELVEQALTTLSEVFVADVACLAGTFGDRLLVTGACGLAEDDPAFQDGCRLGGGAARALATGRPVAVQGPVAPEDLPRSVVPLGIASAVWVPLSTDGHANDLLMIFRRRDEPFGESDLTVLSSVAYRLWLAVRERERTAAMERLAQSGPRLTRHLDLPPLLEEAVDLLRQLTAADRAWIVTTEAGQAWLSAHRGLPPAALDGWPRSVTALDGWSPVTGDAADPDRWAGPLMRVPVFHEGLRTALLFAERDRPLPFGRDSWEAATIFASQLGVAMANAELCRALRRGATHDALTGLGNRLLVRQRLEEALRRTEPGQVGLLFCDLDGFKAVNDRLGHEAGDELLRKVAQRLGHSVRPGDLLARFGGDEFVIVLDGVSGLDQVNAAGARVARALDEPFRLSRRERVRVSASVGGVVGIRGRSTASAMLRDADAAMYAAKDKGRGLVEVFDEAASNRSLQRLDLRSELLHAVDRRELWMRYEPVVALDSGKVLAFEALLGWTHPTRGPIPRAEFIAHAEETGAIVSIGHWVLRQACRHLATWREVYPSGVGITITMTAGQLGQPLLVSQTLDAIQEAGIAPGDVWLEISDHGHIRDDVATSAAALRDAGVHFSLGDFGTACSNLEHLKRFPFEMVKIDRSFVAGVAREREDRSVVRAILAIAESLGCTAVAEGVDSADQRAELVALGCRVGQGRLLSEPLSAEQAAALLAAGSVALATAASGEPAIAATSY